MCTRITKRLWRKPHIYKVVKTVPSKSNIFDEEVRSVFREEFKWVEGKNIAQAWISHTPTYTLEKTISVGMSVTDGAFHGFTNMKDAKRFATQLKILMNNIDIEIIKIKPTTTVWKGVMESDFQDWDGCPQYVCKEVKWDEWDGKLSL